MASTGGSIGGGGTFGGTGSSRSFEKTIPGWGPQPPILRWVENNTRNFFDSIPLTHYLQAALGYDSYGNKLSSDERWKKLNDGIQASSDAVVNGYMMAGTIEHVGGFAITDSLGKIASETGNSIKEVKKAIENVKQGNSWRSGTTNRNPDVKVDIKTGEVYSKTPGGGLGDSIGNIFDYLP